MGKVGELEELKSLWVLVLVGRCSYCLYGQYGIRHFKGMRADNWVPSAVKQERREHHNAIILWRRRGFYIPALTLRNVDTATRPPLWQS